MQPVIQNQCKGPGNDCVALTTKLELCYHAWDGARLHYGTVGMAPWDGARLHYGTVVRKTELLLPTEI